MKYNTNHREAPVAHAIATGVLDKKEIPPELLEHLAASIEFYEEREAAGDMQEDDAPDDDENSRQK